MMTSRERLVTTLDHRQPDRVCVDFGGEFSTSIHASVISQLREALLGEPGYRVKMINPLIFVGEIDDDLLAALPIDVVGVAGMMASFGFRNDGWKPWELPDGTAVLVAGGFNPRQEANGDWVMFPRGDPTLAPSVRMPRDGFYFDPIARQQPIDEDDLDPADNCEEFALLGDDEVAYFAARAEELASGTDYGLLGMLPKVYGYGDQMHIHGIALPQPRGIRNLELWYTTLLTRPDLVHAIFERQTEINLANIRRLAAAVGDRIQVARIDGTDFGAQNGLLFSRQVYRELFRPYYRRINATIHELTNWKTYKHSCGSVYDLIPDFIEDGFDILNPVQTSAAKMDPRTLKREFGRDIVFWGGGVDTQTTLPFGTPEEVYRQVRERIDIFNDGGGFVFAAIHNIQPGVPLPNLLAMLDGIRDSRAA